MDSAVSGAASSVSRTVVNVASGLIFGSYNPVYKKKDRRRMRYIQQKYAQAYSAGVLEDPTTIITRIGLRCISKYNYQFTLLLLLLL